LSARYCRIAANCLALHQARAESASGLRGNESAP
jgi:hypothetical protein